MKLEQNDAADREFAAKTMVEVALDASESGLVERHFLAMTVLRLIMETDVKKRARVVDEGSKIVVSAPSGEELAHIIPSYPEDE